MGNQSTGSLKIVTVEDSPIVVERMQCMLTEINGVEFIGNAKNFTSALSLMNEHQPDVAILDINLEEDMPHSNGINLLIELRKKFEKNICIIMFTNLSAPQYRNTCLMIGADYFFDKSNDFDKIPEVLKEMIKIKKIML